MEQNEVSHLFKNLHQVLKTHGVAALNHAIIAFMNNKDAKKDKINLTLSMVCNEFNISSDVLMFKNVRGQVQDAKQISYCLLNQCLKLSHRYIAFRIFHNQPTSVFNGIKRLRNCEENRNQDKQFLQTYEKLKTMLENQLIK